MLPKKILKALNTQIELEAYASNLYLSMASWCDNKGMAGCAEFMHLQSEEERNHMMRLFHYISEQDEFAEAPQVPKPPLKFDSVNSLFEDVLRHEQKVTKAINEIVGLCYTENDYATLNFMQWYVEEQREEEALMRTILDKIRLIGDGTQSLYYIDREVAKFNNPNTKIQLADQ